jgi:type II secretory pathway pseudopilin PulG
MKLRGQPTGYAMVALLVAMSIMTVMMSMAMPVWKTATQREKEAELIFRGQQYARAIELYQRKLPGAAPPNLNVLIDQKFLRKKYKDPITGEDFELLSPLSPAATSQPEPGQRAGQSGVSFFAQNQAQGPGRMSAPGSQSQGRGGNTPGPTFGIQAGISGVVSKSKATSLRIYNGRNRYNEWQFVYVPRTPAPGAGGVPGAGGGRGDGRGGRGGTEGPFFPGADGGRGRGGRGDGRGGFPPFPDGRGRGDGRGFQNPPNQPPGGRSGPGGQPFAPGGFQPFPPQTRPPGN